MGPIIIKIISTLVSLLPIKIRVLECLIKIKQKFGITVHGTFQNKFLFENNFFIFFLILILEYHNH
jgi:hypothetical protein